jgi:ketosteroid isomerase-like protein
MAHSNVALIRRAYAAYASGDTAAMLDLLDPDLEWTYLDPSSSDPRPQVCHGRGELEAALAQQAQRGLRARLEEVVGHGDKIVVAVRTPGADAHRVRQSDDRDCAVLTVHDGRIVALRDCRDRADALTLAGMEEHS